MIFLIAPSSFPVSKGFTIHPVAPASIARGLAVNADLNLPVFADEILPVFPSCQSKPTAPTRSLSFMR